MRNSRIENVRKRGRAVMWLVGALAVALVAAGVIYVVAKQRKGGLMIYVGSSMRQPMEQCAAAFEKKTGIRIMPSYADSGEVLAQVKLSGMGELAVLHEPYLTQGKRDGWATETFVVATMTPVIAVTKGNPKHVKGLEDFLRPDLRVGMTDYRYGTSGAIAREAMKRAGILDRVLARRPPPYEDKSSGHMAEQVMTKSLDAAIMWDAVAGNYPDKLDVVPIEQKFMPPEFTDSEGVTYHDGHVPVGLLVLTTARHPKEAREFVDFILSPEGQAIWKANGYSPSR